MIREWRKRGPVNALEIVVLFGVMSPSEIKKVFPEYKGYSGIDTLHKRWKAARKVAFLKLSRRNLQQRALASLFETR